jgi:putative salt-induced outer membrane protein YdiY
MNSPGNFRVWLSLTVAILFCFVLPLAAKRKDDMIVMKNGDRFTGEIKGLDHGELVFKSSYMKSSVRLDWNQVERLQSSDSYIVALANGTRVVGVMEKSPTQENSGKDIALVTPDSKLELTQREVIGLQQREQNFWEQLTGSIDYGFSFTSANSHINSSLGLNVAYYTPRNDVQLAASSQFDGQSTGPTANRITFDPQYGRRLTPNWVAVGLFNLLRSNQQDLDLRTTYGGGIGRQLVRTANTSLLAFGGLVYTHEQYAPQAGVEPINNTAEGIVGLQFATFRFRTLEMNSRSLLFPSISDPGRVRLSSQSNLQIEIVRNFFWGFQVYENYDSRPPGSANKNDFGLNTTLGWKF